MKVSGKPGAVQLAKYPGSGLLLCALAWDHTLIATNVFDLATDDHWSKASGILRATLKRPDLKPDERKSCLWASIYVNGHEGRFDQVQREVDEVLTLAPGAPFSSATCRALPDGSARPKRRSSGPNMD